MTKQLNKSLYDPIVYCKANTDTTSLDRLRQHGLSDNNTAVYDIPRAREVGQSYVTSFLMTLYALGVALWYVLVQIQPQVVLCNGPGTCLPLVLAVWVGNVLGTMDCTIVFCESFCRVETLSLTGKILYSLSLTDVFVVHWEKQQQRYPESILTTSILPSQEKQKDS